MDGDEPSLLHILKMVPRRETRAFRQVLDSQDNIITRPREVINTFVTHLSQKYGPNNPDSICVIIQQDAIQIICPKKYADHLEQPIKSEKILTTLRGGDRHETSGIDGISLEFHTANWERYIQNFTRY